MVLYMCTCKASRTSHQKLTKLDPFDGIIQYRYLYGFKTTDGVRIIYTRINLARLWVP